MVGGPALLLELADDAVLGVEEVEVGGRVERLHVPDGRAAGV